MIVTRVIVIDGPDEWVRMLERFLPDGTHNYRPGTIRVKTLDPNYATEPLYVRRGHEFFMQESLNMQPRPGDTNNDTKPSEKS